MPNKLDQIKEYMAKKATKLSAAAIEELSLVFEKYDGKTWGPRHPDAMILALKGGEVETERTRLQKAVESVNKGGAPTTGDLNDSMVPNRAGEGKQLEGTRSGLSTDRVAIDMGDPTKSVALAAANLTVIKNAIPSQQDIAKFGGGVEGYIRAQRAAQRANGGK